MKLFQEETRVPFEAFAHLRQQIFGQILEERKSRQPIRFHDFFYLPKVMVPHSEGIDLLCATYNLELLGAMAFWAEPFSNGLIHRDIDAWGFNIPINEPGGTQVWVEVDRQPNMTTYGGTNEKPYELYPSDTPFRTMGDLKVDRPYFVCTNVLHYTNNSTNANMRMTMSIRFKGPNPLTGS